MSTGKVSDLHSAGGVRDVETCNYTHRNVTAVPRLLLLVCERQSEEEWSAVVWLLYCHSLCVPCSLRRLPMTMHDRPMTAHDRVGWNGRRRRESEWPEKVAVGALLMAQCRGLAGRMLAGIANFHGARAGLIRVDDEGDSAHSDSCGAGGRKRTHAVGGAGWVMAADKGLASPPPPPPTDAALEDDEDNDDGRSIDAHAPLYAPPPPAPRVLTPPPTPTAPFR